jgi:uncharacterized lipoprotein
MSGCALVPDHIDLPYQGQAGASPINGASAITVQVAASDARTRYFDRVSSKINGLGMETAAIVADNDVVATTGAAIEKELAARGFSVGPNGMKLNVQVTRFYNSFRQGMLSGDAVAEVNLDVKLLAADGQVLYANSYYGSGRESGVMLASGSNAKVALSAAMNDSVRQVVTDVGLMNAMLRTALPTSAATTPTS